MKKKMASLIFKGNEARTLVAAMANNDQIRKWLENDKLAPEMRAAVMSEALRRDLIAGNYQI